MESINRYVSENPRSSIELVVVGDGKNRKWIESKISPFAQTKIRFVGAVEREEMVGFYSASDLFAFPGIDEGFGLVYLEAQACELPVLAMNNGGVPDAVLSGKTGLLTPLNDLEAYYSALEALIQNKDLRTMLGSNARPYVVAQHCRRENYNAFVADMHALSGVRYLS